MTISSQCLLPATSSLAGVVSMSILLVAGSTTSTVSAASQPEPILDERVMEISRVSARLAALAYESAPQEQSASVLDASPLLRRIIFGHGSGGNGVGGIEQILVKGGAGIAPHN